MIWTSIYLITPVVLVIGGEILFRYSKGEDFKKIFSAIKTLCLAVFLGLFCATIIQYDSRLSKVEWNIFFSRLIDFLLVIIVLIPVNYCLIPDKKMKQNVVKLLETMQLVVKKYMIIHIMTSIFVMYIKGINKDLYHGAIASYGFFLIQSIGENYSERQTTNNNQSNNTLKWYSIMWQIVVNALLISWLANIHIIIYNGVVNFQLLELPLHKTIIEFLFLIMMIISSYGFPLLVKQYKNKIK